MLLRLLPALLLLLPGVLWGGEPCVCGVTVSCQTWGKEWASPGMASSLDELKGLGAGAVSIHPYARIREDGHIPLPPFGNAGYREHIAAPIRMAHARGMRIMLIPHLAYWGTKFDWRGAIDFRSAAEWNTFFTDYQAWMLQVADIAEAKGAERLCVGLEYTHAQKFPARWRALIAAVRARYHGRLLYAANWDEYKDVAFWDALDEIGVMAYFPLSDAAADPTPAQLRQGWRPHLDALAAFSRAQGGKRVVFTEIGYNTSAHAAARPWAFESGGERAGEIQLRCLDAALALPGRAPWLAGMFLWKWFPDPGPDPDENFNIQTPEVKTLLRSHWAR